MLVEIVTHCYRYPTLLRYQLSSLVLWPPVDLEVKMTVFFTDEDRETASVLEWFGKQNVPSIMWNWCRQTVLELCKRPIGRNLAALATKADWVWFCDADYWFATECWKAFPSVLQVAAPLVYPRLVNRHRLHASGDACIVRAAGEHTLVTADRMEFEPAVMQKAIGGIQIVNGEVCRSRGYLRDSKRAQQPRTEAVFAKNREDVWFRRELGTAGLAIDLPGVYRIRHSKAGRHTPGLVL